MTDLRQAAQQALVALEGLFGLPNQWESGGVAVWRLGGSDASRQAITALKAALEQQAEPPPEWPLIKNILAVFGLDAIAFVAAWKAAQQQAEPVACQSCQDIGGNWAWKCNLCGEVDESREPEPPQRQWVGLTDEEILRADPWKGTSDSNINPYQILLKVRTLEAKLKERNA